MILERGDELRALDGAIARTRHGDGCLVIVEGDPGIGKTTILNAAVERAAAAGVRALRTTGSELEQDYAYGVAIALFEPLLRAASPKRDALFDGVAGASRWLFTPQAAPDRSADAFASILGLYWLALNAAEDSPILMVVDDAQWADGASLRYCGYLSRRLDGVPIGLLLAFRSDVAARDEEAARELRARPTALHLRPKPLSEAAVGTLLDALGEDGTDLELRRASWMASGGNPFFVTELIHTLRDRRSAGARSRGADRLGAPVPDRIMRHIEGRISRLDRTARLVAEAFAILDEEATLPRAAAVARISEEQCVEVAGDLARAAILAGSGSTAFTHPVVRQAVYRSIPVVIRSHLHREVGLLLHREGAPLGVAAAHSLAAERSADPDIVSILCDAARQARGRGDAAVAVKYLRRALDEPPAPSERGRVLIELARAEAALADPSAVDHFREAVDLVEDRRTKAELLLDQGYAQVNAGEWAGAVATFERGVRFAESGAPGLRSRLEVGALSAAWLGTDRRSELLRRAESILNERPLGRHDRELAIWIAFHRAASGMSTASELADEAQRIMASNPIDELVGDARSVELTAGALLAIDGLTEEIDLLSRAMTTAAGGFSFGKVGTYSCYRAWPNYFTGQLAAAVADAHTALRIGELGWDTFQPTSRAVLMFALIERAELDLAQEIGELEDPRWAGRIDAATMIPIARGRLHLERQRVDEALIEFGTARDNCAAIGRRLQMPMDWRTWMVEALMRSGRREEAHEVASELLTMAEAWGARWPLGVAMRAAGVAEGGSVGIEMLRQAVAFLESTPARLESARALVSLGGALRRHGSLNDARTTLARPWTSPIGAARPVWPNVRARSSKPRAHGRAAWSCGVSSRSRQPSAASPS